MPSVAEQPFNQAPRSQRDEELVAKVLGPKEAAEMAELVGDQPSKVESVPTEFEMSAAE